MKPTAIAALALLLLASGCASARKPRPYVIKVTPASTASLGLIQSAVRKLAEATDGVVFAGTAK